MKTNLITLLLILGVFRVGFAQQPDIDSFIKREMLERRIPGLQLAVVKHGKIDLMKSYGMANISNRVPVNNHSIFAINSCTKAFTGVAIMQLVEQGTISLDAAVGDYIDSLPEKWQPVKIWQLLTHISGLPDLLKLLTATGGGLPAGATEAAIWEKLKTVPMEFPTGEQFSYNQTNYALLGKIIDKYSHQPFSKVFEEKQFRPAGMKETVFGDSREVIPDMVQGYRYVTYMDGQNLPAEKLVMNYAEFAPGRRTASGLNSTAGDIANWIISLQQGKLFSSKSSLTRLGTPGTFNNGTPTQWALGWMTKPRPHHRAIIATGGGRSAFVVYPDDDLAIVVLTNLAGSYPEDILDELAGYYNPDIPAADPITTLRMQLNKKGFDQALPVYRELQKARPGFNAPETELNDWAYRMMSSRRLKEATAVFKLVTAIYPDSWNAYDSYGEALLKGGLREEAIKMYQQSIKLNSNNTNGKKILQSLHQ
ncbi:serine hydrolase [Chitinophaga eiseniae]|uniref:Serine hydrolase n=1 Tax=Chitinophaga eiseniae TaxID=634771 RepID=A0A847SFB6_9BACT|nr:serine hydrolase [Chitinophaga eiseniae]NLR78453.1 serine hydrolase [Chitinophaga eiseniae]